MGLGGEHDLYGLRVSLGLKGETALRSRFRPPRQRAGTRLSPWAICPVPYRTFASSLQTVVYLAWSQKPIRTFKMGEAVGEEVLVMTSVIHCN